ncbi:MAG: radical SAM protein, partial [Acidobacteriota bacterium]
MGVQWVVKLSKLCNLRCRYCYEFESLADPARMSPEQLAAFFRHARQAAEQTTGASEFVWHGGEPLAAPPGYFERLFGLQEREFSGTGLEVR